MADMTKIVRGARPLLPQAPKKEEALGNIKGERMSLLQMAQRRQAQREAEEETVIRVEQALVAADGVIAAEEARHEAEPLKAPTNQAPAEDETGVVRTPVDADDGKRKGRPKLDYQTRQLGARVHVNTFARVQAIARRERVGLGPLVDRMVAAWERQRLAEAELIGPRREGEDEDTFIARIFKL